MKELKKYSIELLASLIGDLILFEKGDYEMWDDIKIEFKKCDAVISGIMYSFENTCNETTFYKADITEVLLQFEFSETVFNIEEKKELARLIKLYKV